MKANKLALSALIAANLALCGCAAAALPFIPTIAHVVPRVLFPGHQAGGVRPIQNADANADKADPALAQAITAPPAVEGDTGLRINQQDRVSFQPDADGSIPLRVVAVDLVSDVKARTVGDVVTVNVVESVSSETKQGTTLSNQRQISAGLPNLFMAAESLARHNPMLNLGSLVNGTSANQTAGTGDMTAADTFTATISAIVVAVNPSGTLSIKGERRITINGEDDAIHLSGVVRPEDIDSTNSITSAQVADLQLGITGQGQIRDKQGDGLGTRIFDWLWLF
jgi:flagellar L-ring protein precursor FlgH